MADINRIKVVLVEKKKTNKWLAEQLSKDPATVSKWCTNTSQPDLNTIRGNYRKQISNDKYREHTETCCCRIQA